MPNARLSVRPPVALALFVASTLFAAAAALALPRETARAASADIGGCPVEAPPTPLRALYYASERIAAAQVGESVALEGEGRRHMRRTTFVVTESLKGDPGEQSFFVYHPGWMDYIGHLRKGETVLLFLRRVGNEEPAGYSVTDIRRGVKRLSEADLKIYFKRIEELQWIARQEPPDRTELLEWLVRCAEEPATRWEGAYELAVSSQLGAVVAEEAREKARAAGAQVADATAENVGREDAEGQDEDAGEHVAGESGEPDAGAKQAGAAVTVATAPELPAVAADSGEVVEINLEMRSFGGAGVDPKLAGELTAGQKERLAGVLYGAEKVGEGEMQLIFVVENWDSARLTSFIIRHLEKLKDDPPYDAEQLMYALARVLKDDRLARLAEKYTEKAPYHDDLVEGEEGEAVTASADADSIDAVAGEAEGEEDAEEEEEAEQQANPGEAEEIMAGALVTQAGGARPTASQVRGRMLHNFLAAVERRMNAGDAETARR